MLQKFVFIPLDIFKKNKQNKDIQNELEAWFEFLSDDRPDRIIQLIQRYPRFREMYSDIYEICRNVERVVGMFSKELLELDRNTVQYMIDEMQETIDKQDEELNRKRSGNNF